MPASSARVAVGRLQANKESKITPAAIRIEVRCMGGLWVPSIGALARHLPGPGNLYRHQRMIPDGIAA